MSDYISRAAAVAAIVAIRDELTEKKAYGWEWEYNGLNYAIQALPLPAADVAPVVRCKDCRWHKDVEPGMVYCTATVGGWVENDWFCKGGKRKDGDGDG